MSWLKRIPSTSATLAQDLLWHSILLHGKGQSCPLHHIWAQANPSGSSSVPGQGGKARQEHPPSVFSQQQRKGSAGSACGSLKASTDLAVNTCTCPGPLQGRGGFLCQRSLSPLPCSLLPPTSTPNAMRQHTASSGKAVISRSLSALHSHQQGGKNSALDEPKDDSSFLLQLLTP